MAPRKKRRVVLPEPSNESSDDQSDDQPFTQLTVGGITKLKSRNSLEMQCEPITLQVLSVYRYTMDQSIKDMVMIDAPVLPDPDSSADHSNDQSMDDDDVILLSQPGAPSWSNRSHGIANLLNKQSSQPSVIEYGYDLILSDGQYQAKCALSPALNHLVDCGDVLTGVVVSIFDYCVRHDDSSDQLISQSNNQSNRPIRAFVLVRALNVRLYANETIINHSINQSGRLSYLSGPKSRERAQIPLLGARKYYIGMLVDDVINFDASMFDHEVINQHITELEGSIEAARETLEQIANDPSNNQSNDQSNNQADIQSQIIEDQRELTRLQFIENDNCWNDLDLVEHTDNLITIYGCLTEGTVHQSARRSKTQTKTLSSNPERQQIVIVRVTAKSRIYRWRDTHQKNLSPFKFSLIVRDDSASLQVTLWNNLVSHFYHSIKVGDILAFSNHRIKQIFNPDHDQPTNQSVNQSINQCVEVSLNPSGPAAKICINPLHADELEPPVPPVAFGFISCEDLMITYCSSDPFDFCGLVVYASRVERSVNPSYNQFFMYRWLLIADDTLNGFGLPVKVWANSQELSLIDCSVGQTVCLTNLMLHDDYKVKRSSDTRSLFATATPFTQIYQLNNQSNNHSDNLLFHREARVDAMLEWAAELDDPSINQLSQTCRSLWYHEIKRIQSQTEPTEFSRLRSVSQSLKFVELKTVFVRCLIRSIRVLPAALEMVDSNYQSINQSNKQSINQTGKQSNQSNSSPSRHKQLGNENNNDNDQSAEQASEQSNSRSGSIPLDSGTYPLFVLTLVSLNHDDGNIEVALHNHPEPHVRLDRLGSITNHITDPSNNQSSKPLPQLPSLLPRGLRLLLDFLPAETVINQSNSQSTNQILEQLIVQLQPPPVKKRPRRRRRNEVERLAGSDPEHDDEPPPPQRKSRISSSQPVQSNNQSNDQSINHSNNQSINQTDNLSLSEDQIENILNSVCDQWLIDKVMLAKLSFYRHSSQVVDQQLTEVYECKLVDEVVEF